MQKKEKRILQQKSYHILVGKPLLRTCDKKNTKTMRLKNCCDYNVIISIIKSRPLDLYCRIRPRLVKYTIFRDVACS